MSSPLCSIQKSLNCQDLFCFCLNSLVDPALQIHRAHTGGNILHAFVNDGLGENRGGRRAVAGVVARLGGDFTHHAGAHVFELVLEFDFLGDGHAVFRHRRW